MWRLTDVGKALRAISSTEWPLSNCYLSWPSCRVLYKSWGGKGDTQPSSLRSSQSTRERSKGWNTMWHCKTHHMLNEYIPGEGAGAGWRWLHNMQKKSAQQLISRRELPFRIGFTILTLGHLGIRTHLVSPSRKGRRGKSPLTAAHTPAYQQDTW